MKPIGNTIFRLLILFTVLTISYNIAYSVGIGISPTNINLQQILRGGYAETRLTLTNPSTDEVAYLVEIKGDEASWFSFEPATSGYLPAKSSIRFKVIAEPPTFVPIGNYSVYLIFYGAPTSQQQNTGAGTKIIAGVAVPIDITISDLQIEHYILKDVITPFSEECYPIKIYLDIQNDGNVRVTPSFHVRLLDSRGMLVKELDNNATMILPTVTERRPLEIPYQIEGEYRCVPQGKYNVEVVAYLGGNLMYNITRPLEILERGAITLRGEISNLSIPSNVSAGQVVKLNAIFKNMGEREISAKLKAEVYRNSSLVDVVEGDEVRVWPGSSETISAYFTPEQVGGYIITGWSVFEGKTTNSISIPINVSEGQLPLLEIVIIAILVAIIIGVIIWWKRNH